jgi:hypothetical protein
VSDPGIEPTRIDQPPVVLPPEPVGPGGGSMPPGGPVPPGEEDPDRRPWILAGVLALIVLVLVVLLLAGGDDDDDSDDIAVESTTTSETTTTSESTTTEPATTTTAEVTTTTAGAPPVVTVPPEECADAGTNAAQPGLAAGTVFEAWVRGDLACAATLMNPDALAELFSRDGTGATDQFQGCTDEDMPDPHADCAFTYEGGATHYLMNFSPTDGWKVFDVTQVAD